MSQDIIALVAGTLLAVAALAYVLHPLFFPRGRRSPSAVAPPMEDDAIEARVRALRSRHVSCAHCGVRPEADAVYCSSCGRRLRALPTAR